MEFLNAVTWLLAIFALAATMYQIVGARLLKGMATRPFVEPHLLPRVSLLKPLCGDEPGLEANLRSFCRQTYPHYQIVFGVHDRSDPALPIVRRLREEFPDRDIAIAMGTGRPANGNPKISNLLSMMPMAKHEILVLSDSDTYVEPNCLSAIVATLERPNVGIATCLYVGRPTGGLWSRLGAMGINHNFLPSVAVAEALGRRDGCYGAILALRRETLERIGGFGQLRECLADDYYLGAAVRKMGLEIAVAPSRPSCRVSDAGFRTLFDHEVRWGRTLAGIERLGYTASMITYNVFWAFLVLLANHALAGVGVFAVAFLGRLWAVRNVGRMLGLNGEPVWLVAARDLFSMAVHVTALAGRTVRWRGRRMRIGSNGMLLPVEGSDLLP